jgi:hypothetical protein
MSRPCPKVGDTVLAQSIHARGEWVRATVYMVEPNGDKFRAEARVGTRHRAWFLRVDDDDRWEPVES